MSLDLRKARDLGHLRIAEEELRRQKALTVKYNALTDMLEIEGITYAGDFFRQFASTMPLNTPLKITSRDDGVLTIAKLEPWDRDWGGWLEDGERPDARGYCWHYQVEDFGSRLAICGRIEDPIYIQQRYGAVFSINRWASNDEAARTKIARAKELICQRIAEGRGIKGDDVVARREEPLPDE